MNFDYDIAIIGLGPAGSTFARLIGERYRVIAFDKKRQDCAVAPGDTAGFEKPCGGLLAPDAQLMLGRFGLTLPHEVLVDPQIFAVKTIDLQAGLTRYYQRFYLNCDRPAFDRWLMSLIPEHVDCHHGSRLVGVRPLEAYAGADTAAASGYLLRVAEGAAQRDVRVRWVVGADGSFSPVRHQLMPAAAIKRYVACQEVFADENEQPFYSVIFDNRITPCYCWALSKNGRFILGGAFEHEDCRARLAQLKTQVAAYGFCLGESLQQQSCLVSWPTRPSELCLGDLRGAFLVGEAAGFISPSSLEGVSYALDSAQLLARAFNEQGDSVPGPGPDPARLYQRYRQLSAPLRHKLIRKTGKAFVLYHPLLRRAVMQSGLSAITPL
ncbi:MAG: FAD-binding protein [Coriobacteriia bacterium]|nr:FAD-binding protein [Coriobacteriia bacterium]